MKSNLSGAWKRANLQSRCTLRPLTEVPARAPRETTERAAEETTATKVVMTGVTARTEEEEAVERTAAQAAKLEVAKVATRSVEREAAQTAA